MIRAWLATFDLNDNRREAVRARFNDSNVEVRRISSGLWHLTRDDHHADFKRLGKLMNDDTVFLVLATAPFKTYLRNRIGVSRVVLVRNAWDNPNVRAVLGGVTMKHWLLANGFNETLGGRPVVPFTRAGIPPAAIADDYPEPTP